MNSTEDSKHSGRDVTLNIPQAAADLPPLPKPTICDSEPISAPSAFCAQQMRDYARAAVVAALAQAVPQAAQQDDTEVLAWICKQFGWRVDGNSNVLADRIVHQVRDLQAGSKARDTLLSQASLPDVAMPEPARELSEVINYAIAAHKKGVPVELIFTTTPTDNNGWLAKFIMDAIEHHRPDVQDVASFAPAQSISTAVRALPSKCWWHRDGHPVFNNTGGDDLILRKSVLELLAAQPAETVDVAMPEQMPEVVRIEGEPEESLYRRMVYKNGWNACLEAVRAAQPAEGSAITKPCQYPNCGCTSRATCNLNYDASHAEGIAQVAMPFNEQIFRTMVATWAHNFPDWAADDAVADKRDAYWKSVLDYISAHPRSVAPAAVVRAAPANALTDDRIIEIVGEAGLAHGANYGDQSIAFARAIERELGAAEGATQAPERSDTPVGLDKTTLDRVQAALDTIPDKVPRTAHRGTILIGLNYVQDEIDALRIDGDKQGAQGEKA